MSTPTLPPLPSHRRKRIVTAAEHAEGSVFPGGAIGRLIGRELRAYAEMGLTYGTDALSEQLCAEVYRLHGRGLVVQLGDGEVTVRYAA